MLYFGIGAIVGATMGLTGAGGALIAIPLFMQTLHLGFREASVLSLVTVFVAAALNLIGQHRKIQWKVVIPLLGFSLIGTWLGIPLKAILSESVLLLLMGSVAIFSLGSVWLSPKASLEERSQKFLPLAMLSGLLLGLLTTLTGLGGGVLMVPVMLRFFYLPMDAAVATSLVATGTSSVVSLSLQASSISVLSEGLSLVKLILGIAVAAFILKWTLKKMTSATQMRLQQNVLTVVVLIAIAKILHQLVS
jgi:hypothetical protein